MTAVHARELAYVILSGGRSTRFGANKAGAKINGSGLLDRLVAAFLAGRKLSALRSRGPSGRYRFGT